MGIHWNGHLRWSFPSGLPLPFPPSPQQNGRQFHASVREEEASPGCPESRQGKGNSTSLYYMWQEEWTDSHGLSSLTHKTKIQTFQVMISQHSIIDRNFIVEDLLKTRIPHDTTCHESDLAMTIVCFLFSNINDVKKEHVLNHLCDFRTRKHLFFLCRIIMFCQHTFTAYQFLSKWKPLSLCLNFRHEFHNLCSFNLQNLIVGTKVTLLV